MVTIFLCLLNARVAWIAYERRQAILRIAAKEYDTTGQAPFGIRESDFPSEQVKKLNAVTAPFERTYYISGVSGIVFLGFIGLTWIAIKSFPGLYLVGLAYLGSLGIGVAIVWFFLRSEMVPMNGIRDKDGNSC